VLKHWRNKLNNTKQTLKIITKNSRTVGGPYHQWGPPSLDAAATPSLRHCQSSVRSSVVACCFSRRILSDTIRNHIPRSKQSYSVLARHARSYSMHGWSVVLRNTTGRPDDNCRARLDPTHRLDGHLFPRTTASLRQTPPHSTHLQGRI